MKSLAALVKENPEQAAELLEAVLFSSYKEDDKDSVTINVGVIDAIRAFAMGKAKKTWMVRYEHRFGTDVWMVRSVKEPSAAEVIKTCGVEFEPDRHETLYVSTPQTVDLDMEAERKKKRKSR
jgi:hypothetical protein